MLLEEERQELQAATQQVASYWWWFLISSLVWLLIALIVLRLNMHSVTTVGILLGVVFLVAAAAEALVAMLIPRWQWLRGLLAALFLGGAIWCFIRPYHAFWSLAAALGFLLVFKGTVDIIESISAKPINDVWWLGLVTGILEIGLGFWASEQYIQTRAVLLLLFVGFFALFRGLSDLVLAFEVKGYAKVGK